MKNTEEIEITINQPLTIKIKDSNLKHLTKQFLNSLLPLFQEFVKKAMQHFGQKYMENGMLAKLLKCKKKTLK